MTQLINVFLYTLHFIISLFLILVVLLQQGKGADLSVFGGGASQAAFGARGAATVLHKATVVCFVLFIITTLTIGIVQARANTSIVGGIQAVETPASSDLTAPAGGTLPEDEAQTAPAGEQDSATDSAEQQQPAAETPSPAPAQEPPGND